MFDIVSKRLPHLTVTESFGVRLRRLRLQRAMTQAELGKKVGLSTRMVHYYEAQRGNPSAPLLAKFAEALGVSLDDLMQTQHETEAGPARTPTELRLWRRLRRILQLPAAERQAVLHFIDALIAGHKRK